MLIPLVTTSSRKTSLASACTPLAIALLGFVMKRGFAGVRNSESAGKEKKKSFAPVPFQWLREMQLSGSYTSITDFAQNTERN
jgi:hypothetical protein